MSTDTRTYPEIFSSNARIVIFGGTGSLGTTLIDRLMLGDLNVVVYSRDESKQWTLATRYKNFVDAGKLTFTVGDVRDCNAVEDVLRTYMPNFIIIASALKHIDVCEMQPYESIATNIMGVQNIVDTTYKLGFPCRLCFVSTDKACSPVNVYGMSKAIAERIVMAKGRLCMTADRHRSNGQVYAIVRYGNVLNSRGSIIPLFRSQVDASMNVTVTHPSMTRFFMTLDDSVDLIFDALVDSGQGEVWIPRLSSMKIIDLAEIFAERYDVGIDIVGVRPGEKFDEALINDVESQRCVTRIARSGRERFVLTSMYNASNKAQDLKQWWYTSADDIMSKNELSKKLVEFNLI